jgi:hypothetical protein
MDCSLRNNEYLQILLDYLSLNDININEKIKKVKK